MKLHYQVWGLHMFLKQLAMNRFGAIAVFCMAVGFTVSADSAAAQQFKMNIGCPSLGSSNIGQYTIDQLNQLCHNSNGSGGGSSSSSNSTQPSQVSSAENGAALSCGQHKALAAFARMNPGFVEGETSQVIVDKYCSGKPDSAAPGGSQSGGDQLSGIYKFERGYHTQYSGSKKKICRSYYSGDIFVHSGRVQFTSGGHTWHGTISQNSYISITRDGVTPRPKNPTSITGPVQNAELYNGYCGKGFFRVSKK